MPNQLDPLPSRLTFLKLGGSLITDKTRPKSPRREVLERTARETADFFDRQPDSKLLLGHGSGSFGHTSAREFATRQGVKTRKDWQGFHQVGNDAAELHQLFMEAMRRAGLPVLSFPPSAAITAKQRKIVVWNLEPIQNALDHGLIPVVYGDVVIDRQLGGTILSTEDLFSYLSKAFKPQRILLAGKDSGVYRDFPTCNQIIREIHPEDADQLDGILQSSEAPDVTGGMITKVQQMIKLVEQQPDLEIDIFSGEEDGNLLQSLSGEQLGTRLKSSTRKP